MIIDLNKSELVNLIKGQGLCSYTLMNELDKKDLGKLTGFPNERWYWNSETLNSMSEYGLYEVYMFIKGYKDPKQKKASPRLSKERIRELQESYFKTHGKWLKVREEYL